MLYTIKSNPFVSVVIILLITSLVLLPTLTNGWLGWDDKINIIDNLLVRSLSWERIKLIFQTSEINGSYMPLPILTWAVNYHFGGFDPFGFHLVNLILHLGITSLVFFCIQKLTNNAWVAILTAFLFGIHPMHVETVAWITGRKDLLYAIFFAGSLLSWAYYIESKQNRSALYVLALLLFIPSLFSKGVAVVLPLFLLLTDHFKGRTDYLKMITEKIPFFGLSLAFGLMSIHSQSQTAALNTVSDVPIYLSAFTSAYSLTLYLVQSIFPFQIGGFHPYPPNTGSLPWYMLLSITTPIALLTLLFFLRKNKTVVYGIGLTLVGFLPVIQLLPVGDALVADRYTYMPYLGLFFLYSWLAVSVFKKLRAKMVYRNLLTVFGLVYCGWLTYTANAATHIWESPETLWSNVINQHPHNEKGYINRGRFRMEKGQSDLAKADFEKALKIAPNLPVMHQELGLYNQSIENYQEAEKSFSSALSLDSLYHPARLNLGINYMRLNRFNDAIKTFKTLALLDTSNILVHLNLGVIYEGQNAFDLAIKEYDKAILKQPLDYRGYQYRGVVFTRVENYQQALADIEKWVALSPRDGKAYLWKSRVAFLRKDYHGADAASQKAIKFGADVNASYLQMITDSLKAE